MNDSLYSKYYDNLMRKEIEGMINMNKIIEYNGKKYDVIKETKKDTCCVLPNDTDLFLCIKEHKESILDEKEKRYLKNVIKYVINPTHNKIKYIRKIDYWDNTYYISIVFDNCEELALPSFKGKIMYKGMTLDKDYTLKELELED